MTFPDNPFIGQTVEINGTTKQWDGAVWRNITNGNKELRLRTLEKYVGDTVLLSEHAESGEDVSSVLTTLEGNSNISTVVVDVDVRVASNTTCSKVLKFINYAKITLDAELTISAQPAVDKYAQLFVYGTGKLLLHSDHKIQFVESYWFGTKPYDATLAVAQGNMKAISRALEFTGSLGIGTQSDGRTPICYIPPFLTVVDLPSDHEDGVGARIPSYVPLRGRQFNDLLSVRSGASTMDIFRIDQSGANGIQVGNFQVDGNYASQTNLQTFLRVNPTGAPAIYCNIGEGTLYVKEMSGYGLVIEEKGMDNSTLHPYVVRDSGRNALLVSACNDLDVYGRWRTSKTIYANMLFDSTNVWSATLHGVSSREAGGAGLWVSNINSERGEIKVVGGDFESNGTSGVIFDRAGASSLENASTNRNGDHGFSAVDCSGINWSGGQSKFNKKRGGQLTRVNDSSLGEGTCIDSNSDTNVNTYDGITMFTCDNNFIDGLMVRNKNSTQRYGLAIDDAVSDTNKLGNVDLRNSGNTGEISDSGTGTIGVEYNLSLVQTVSIPANGNTSFVLSSTQVDESDSVIRVASEQLDGILYTTRVSAGQVTVYLFNNTTTQIDITNLNVTVFLRS